jgi:glycosyltransferase involved in cell wall biosynthesis
MLPSAIGSVRAQTFEDWELFIVDDGSSCGTAVPREAEATDERVTFLALNPTPRQRAASVRYARNLNLAALNTTGEYLTFLCGDDFYMPDRLERMLAVLEPQGFPLCDVAYGAQRVLYEDQPEGLRPTQGVLEDAALKVDLNSVMLTRSAFEHVGGFPDTPPTPMLWRQADAELWRRLNRLGYVFVPVPGGPTDTKRYRDEGVDARVIRGETPWLEVA